MATGVESNAEYKQQSYWDKRFEQEDGYEWLVTYDGVAEILKTLLPQPSLIPKILVVGCGNSSFSHDLHQAGYDDITSIDFSPVVIEKMKAKYAEPSPKLKWEVQDMTNLQYDPESFDVVIDKAAMDALCTDVEDIWDPQEELVRTVDKMCAGVWRVLKPSGLFLQISFEQPHFRTKLLQVNRSLLDIGDYYRKLAVADLSVARYNWAVSYHTLEQTKSLPHFLYVAKKNDR